MLIVYIYLLIYTKAVETFSAYENLVEYYMGSELLHLP